MGSHPSHCGIPEMSRMLSPYPQPHVDIHAHAWTPQPSHVPAATVMGAGAACAAACPVPALAAGGTLGTLRLDSAFHSPPQAPNLIQGQSQPLSFPVASWCSQALHQRWGHKHHPGGSWPSLAALVGMLRPKKSLCFMGTPHLMSGLVLLPPRSSCSGLGEDRA